MAKTSAKVKNKLKVGVNFKQAGTEICVCGVVFFFNTWCAGLPWLSVLVEKEPRLVFRLTLNFLNISPDVVQRI